MITFSDVRLGKILIVDDKRENVILLEQMLRGAGYVSIDSTLDSSGVCGLYRENRYDLILLDLRMPGMDGFQVMEGLKEIELGGVLPVIALTAEPELKLRALKAGAMEFVSKPFELSEVLIRVRNMIEVRLLQREARMLYDQIVEEQKVSERLLHNVLPVSIARRLKGRLEVASGGFAEVIADRFDDVTVLFADIVGFTKFSESVSAEALVDVLNDVFTCFDGIADDRGLEKIKTIGDAYMAVAGLPVLTADHAARAAHMALDIIESLARYNDRSRYQLEVRIGVSSGPAVAGVIGKRKFLYDLWGDVVNVASRMESHGVPGRIQVADATRRLLGDPFVFEERGAVDIKGKGEMRTWFLNGRNGQGHPASRSSAPPKISALAPVYL
jgi:adenylate cyclase